MTTLFPIIAVPVLAGLLCLLVRSQRLMEITNVVAFAFGVAAGIQLLRRIVFFQVITEWDEFFRADALSAWMVLLISIVSLGTSLYAGRYFHRDLAAGAITPGRVKEFFVLTPLFTAGMF